MPCNNEKSNTVWLETKDGFSAYVTAIKNAEIIFPCYNNKVKT